MRKVVNITSIAGTDGNAGQAGYSSGKAGVIGLTKTMAKEWGRYNVNVNAVGFGLIQTRLIQPLSGEGASYRHQRHVRSLWACSREFSRRLRLHARSVGLGRPKRRPMRCCSSVPIYPITLPEKC